MLHSDRLQRVMVWLLGAGAALAAASVLSRAWFEFSSGALDGDALIFQTVGRGILNGKLPYADLFESKPPGIFLLHALSLALFGHQFLVKSIQAVALLLLPILIVLPVLGAMKRLSGFEQRMMGLASVLFACLLTLYTADQAGLGLTESYAAFLTLLFLNVAVLWKQSSWKKIAALGCIMLLTVGIREPFLLVLLAGMLLLHTEDDGLLRHFLRISFVRPAAVACVIGIVMLTALGYLGPFFTVYLPHMIGFHIHQYDTPILLRSLEVWRVAQNIGRFSWPLAVSVLMLWIMALVHSARSHGTSRILQWVAATVCVLIAIAIGGDFYGHHFVAAVPLYAALWWVGVRDGGMQSYRTASAVLACLLITASVSTVKISYAAETKHWREREREFTYVALVLDDVMDRCKLDHYLQFVTRGGGPYAYAHHSPDGPLFVHYTRFMSALPRYTRAFNESLQAVPLVLMDNLENPDLKEIIKVFLRPNFTTDSPACAGEHFVQPLPYYILFRVQN
ncbi:hypothetical protein FJZ28_00480 [Candidatus Peregrinibacteria bacterium]|nr:hypothetical protein [Candidatus Peregrinibacteria bacterium]